jgi:hypothetical protein
MEKFYVNPTEEYTKARMIREIHAVMAFSR